jgi:hypothetical protein
MVCRGWLISKKKTAGGQVRMADGALKPVGVAADPLRCNRCGLSEKWLRTCTGCTVPEN